MSITKVEQVIAQANDTRTEPLQFRTGRGQAINMFYDNPSLPLLWLITPSSNGPIGNNLRINLSYPIELFVYYNDKVSSDEDSSTQLIKQAEMYAQILFLNIQNVSSDNDVTITGMNIQPVYKYSAKGVFTGVSLQFTMEFPDVTNFCAVDVIP